MGKKNVMFMVALAALFMSASCSNGTRKNSAEAYSAKEVEQARQMEKYYDTSLEVLRKVVPEKSINSVLEFMEQEDVKPVPAPLVPPVYSQKDSAFVVNPGDYFDEETRRNLIQSYMKLFKTRKLFYANYDRYLSLLKANDKAEADKILPVNYQLSVDLSEYKENILDMLTPFMDDAQSVLLNGNPMKEQLLYMKRMTATMHSILYLCKRKPAPDMARLDMKLMKLVIQLDIARRLPAVEGHPQEMKEFQDFLEDVENFIKDVQHIKSEERFNEEYLAALEKYGVSLD